MAVMILINMMNMLDVTFERLMVMPIMDYMMVMVIAVMMKDLASVDIVLLFDSFSIWVHIISINDGKSVNA